MLYLYQSNRLEYLAEKMAGLHAGHPPANPLAAEEIVVQSQGMRRFINRFLAQRQGIAANLNFSLPAGLAWRLMRSCLRDIPELSPFAPEVMRWRLLDLFAGEAFQTDSTFQAAREALAPQLEKGALAAYMLAGSLADVFDQYLVYRPDWIKSWQAGKTPPDLADSSAASWQAALWRQLASSSPLPHRVELWRRLNEYLDTQHPKLPGRYCVFGIAALAPVYLDLLQRLAKHSDVHIFALNPSAGYWGDVLPPEDILNLTQDTGLSASGHPLLAVLGKQGRDFFNALAEAETYADDENGYSEHPASHSLLHTLQYHIQTLTLPEDGRAQWLENHGIRTGNGQNQEPDTADTAERSLACLQNDGSIRIHSAHSRLRELQALKEYLLARLAEDPALQPHDIAVLTPHIEPYAPYIEAVFGESSGCALPYAVSDVKLSHRRPLLNALEQVFALAESRFEADLLLPLLENGAVLARFGLSGEDLPLLYDTVSALNIRWGADTEQRHEAGSGGNDALFTWQQGLQRLVLGWMQPENSGLWQGISPWTSRPEHLDTLAGFAALVRLLADTRREWQTPADSTVWAERVRRLAENLFAPEDTDREAMQHLEQALANWQAETALAGFRLPLDRGTALSHIRRFLDTPDETGFLSRGITFCSMVPMRSLPFKTICLLGLNDGEFPRDTRAAEFDLIARHPKPGDRTRRNDDRYLFLEALMSARETLYLSYIGRDIRSDEALAPSTLIDSLTDNIATLTGIPAGTLWTHWVVQHPLQAFSPRYFLTDSQGQKAFPRLHSAHSGYAAALSSPEATPDFTGGFTLPENTPQGSLKTEEAADWHDFVRFWRNPVRYWLRQLGWTRPYAEDIQDSAEPFDNAFPRQLAEAYIDAGQNSRDFQNLPAELAARSLLPAGETGRLIAQSEAGLARRLDSSLLRSERLPVHSGTFMLESGRLDYRLDNLYRNGQILRTADLLNEDNQNGKLGAPDKIELLLRHLAHCAAPSEQIAQENTETFYRTCCLLLPEPLVLPPVPRDAARQALSKWLAAYRRGQTAPLPFFPKTTLAAATALAKGQDWEKAQKEAQKKYHRGQYAGQEDDPEIRLVYGRDTDAPPPYTGELFRRLAENLFAELAECLDALDA